MKKHWRILSAAVALVTVLSVLAGCGGSKSTPTPAPSGDSNTQGEAKPWTGTITVWDGPRWDTGDGNKFFYIEERIKQFEADNPGVKVELVQVPWAEMPTKLVTSIGGGAWPDIAPVDISGGGVSLEQVEQGLVVSMDKYLTPDEKANYYPAAVEAYSHNGTLYGLPTSMTVHTLLLNLDLFQQAGVEPPKDGKWTWDEFREKMIKLSTTLGDKQVWGFSTYIRKGYWEFWPFLLMDGGEILKDGKFAMDSPEVIGALKKMQDLKMVDNATAPEYGIENTGDVFQAFANPDKRWVAVEPWATWAIATLQTNATLKMDNFMVAEYPTGKSGKPVTISGAGGLVVFKQDSPEKEAMVVKLAKWLSNDQVQVDFAKYYGTMPATTTASAMNPFEGNEHMQRAVQMLEQGVTIPTKVPGWSELEPLIQAELQLVIAGEKTPEEAMTSLRPEAERLLGK